MVRPLKRPTVSAGPISGRDKWWHPLQGYHTYLHQPPPLPIAISQPRVHSLVFVYRRICVRSSLILRLYRHSHRQPDSSSELSQSPIYSHFGPHIIKTQTTSIFIVITAPTIVANFYVMLFLHFCISQAESYFYSPIAIERNVMTIICPANKLLRYIDH